MIKAEDQGLQLILFLDSYSAALPCAQRYRRRFISWVHEKYELFSKRATRSKGVILLRVYLLVDEYILRVRVHGIATRRHICDVDPRGSPATSWANIRLRPSKPEALKRWNRNAHEP